MPQFDPSSFPSQLFWLAVCFAVLYALMSRVALPRIAEVLTERQRRVDNDRDRAAQLRNEAEAAIQAYERALAEARIQAHGIAKSADEDIARLVHTRTKEVAERLAVQVKGGEDRIAAARDAALTQVRDIAADAAQAMVSRLVGVSVDGSKALDAVGVAIQERG
ncbi:MAG: F0F1 ATP synthase subunit B' [Alphaproteobacteria bacterium]|nr:F0F1 ATP synthase subunit B' [Alphaproteobacteria bacterium]MBF0129931.1 F0F1 ATP synthase subunit B' [Alphaproteobacteria bacterium]